MVMAAGLTLLVSAGREAASSSLWREECLPPPAPGGRQRHLVGHISPACWGETTHWVNRCAGTYVCVPESYVRARRISRIWQAYDPGGLGGGDGGDGGGSGGGGVGEGAAVHHVLHVPQVIGQKVLTFWVLKPDRIALSLGTV